MYDVLRKAAGFDVRYPDKLFSVFQRLHSDGESGGIGDEIVIVAREIEPHGGQVWADKGTGAARSACAPAHQGVER